MPPLPHTFKPCRWSSTSRRGDPALRPAREPASARTPCLGRATCRRFADSFRADDGHSGNTGSPAFMTTPNLARHDVRAGAICLQAPLRQRETVTIVPFCCGRQYRQEDARNVSQLPNPGENIMETRPAYLFSIPAASFYCTRRSTFRSPSSFSALASPPPF